MESHALSGESGSRHSQGGHRTRRRRRRRRGGLGRPCTSGGIAVLLEVVGEAR